MLRVFWVHGCEPGRVSDGSRPALCQTLSLSNAARLSFSDLCILLFLFLSLCRLCVCVFLCSHWSLVDVPLIFFLSSRPRTGLATTCIITGYG